MVADEGASMNRVEITRLAQEAGFVGMDGEHGGLRRFAALVASAEREACAEICRKHADFYAGLEPSPIAQSAWAACVDNRDAIRARGQA
jgi:hypothetical protein